MKSYSINSTLLHIQRVNNFASTIARYGKAAGATSMSNLSKRIFRISGSDVQSRTTDKNGKRDSGTAVAGSFPRQLNLLSESMPVARSLLASKRSALSFVLSAFIVLGMLNSSVASATGDPNLGSASFTPNCGVCHSVSTTNFQTYLANTYSIASLLTLPSGGGIARSVNPGYAVATATACAASGNTNNTMCNMDTVAYRNVLCTSVTTGTTCTASAAAADIQAFLGLNVIPTVAGQSATVNANSSNNTIDLSASITGGTPATITVTPGASIHGTVSAGTVTNPGVSGGSIVTSVTYTPTAGYAGAASFSYTVSNSGGTSTSATVSITVNAVAPGAPTSVTAATNNLSGQLVVSFVDPTNNGGSTINNYTATCISATPGATTPVSNSVINNATATSVTVGGLTNGASYSCSVTAANAAGTGLAGSTASNAIPRTVPSAPASVTAATNNLGGLSVSFAAPANNGATISQYNASCTSATIGAVGGTGSVTGNPPATSITVSNLTTGAPYNCSVTATNAAGVSSAGTTASTAVPTAPPGAPTSVTAATAGAGQLTISFIDPVNNGGATINNYTATCTSASPGANTPVSNSVTNNPTATSVTVSGLTGGSPYSCSVTAANSAGTGTAGNTTGTTTPLSVSSAPNVSSIASGNTSATIYFSAPTSTGGGTITGYTATCTTGATSTTNTGGPTATSITVSNLTNGSLYNCNVAATTSGAGLGTPSGNWPVTPATVPGAPTSVTAAPNNLSGQLQVSFVAPASNGGATINNYSATCNSSSGGVTGTGQNNNAAATTVVVNGLTNGASYSCSVTATNSAGTGLAGSTLASAIPRTAPSAPANVSVASNNLSGQLVVSFTSPNNNGSAITGITASCTPSIGGSAQTASTSDPSATSIVVSGLSNGTGYNCSVTATNAAGVGATGSASSSSIPATVPGASSISTIVIGDGQVTVNFAAAANNGAAITGYTVTTNPAGGVDTNANSTSLSHVVTGLTNHTTYTFTVIATNSAGVGAPSATATGTPEAIPAATNSKATVYLDSSNNVITPVISGTVNTPGLNIQTPASSFGPLHGSVQALANNTFSYTPTVGFYGSDSFVYSVTGPGGTSANATISVTIIPPLPTVTNATMQVLLNSSATLDLTQYVTGTAITGVEVSSQPSHGGVTVAGMKVTYTPTKDYFGTDSFTYQAHGAGGTSVNATVSVIITGRPDPLKDARVTGLINAETAAIKRFGMVQVFNFQQRLESRHHAVYDPSPMSPPVSSGTSAPAGGSLPGQTRGYFNSWQPGTVLSYENDPNVLLHTAQLSGNQQSGASNPMYGTLMNMMAGALTSYSLNLGTVTNVVGNAPDDEFSRLEVWAAGNLRFGTRTQSGFESRFTTDGISVGADKRIDRKLTLGMGMGYARDKSSIGSDGTNSSATGNSVAGYASYQTDSGTFMDVLLGYGKVTFNTNRFVPAVNEFASATRNGDQLFGSFSYGYEYRKDGLLWSPYGRFDYSFDRLKQGAESGAGINALSYASQNLSTSHLAFGMRAQSVHQTNFGVVQPHVRLEYQRAKESNGQTSVSYADMLDVQYTVASTSQGSNAFVIGWGSDFVMSDTLRVALDYQRLRSSGVESYQSVNLRLTKTIKGKNDLASLLEEGYDSTITKPTGWTVITSLSYDDNVSRASEAADKLSDTIYGLTVNKALSMLPTKFTRLTVSGFMDVEKFRNYAGLSHISGGAQGEFAYRFSGDFGSPTIGAFVRYTADAYESGLRDGDRRSVGMNLRKPLTDRINLFAAVADNVRNGKSDVFNTHDNSGRMNLDYALAPGQTLYLTGEYRKGDIVSSGRPSIQILDSSIVFVRDDVFVSPWFSDYRMKGKTSLMTLGYNFSFGTKDSVDLAWRHVKSTPDKTPAYAGTMQYIDNQFSVSYLMAF